ncbi:MAG TPA: TAXI family TRAP transporter solute-binding subunit [Xanthobacteraceae bacterium]|nr:TAXI family TRAP transporter solute-binding subunit [Xanthobacteraceae bacterium]
MKTTTFACVPLLLALAAAPAQAQAISIVSTPSGSYTNSAGAAMAKVISEKTKLRAILQAQSQQGMIPVEAGNAEFGMANSFDMTFYGTGTGEYEGQGRKDKVRIAASLIPYRVAFHVRADSPMKTIADVKGKRIAGGFNAQKTIARITEALLATAGLSYKDMQEVLAPNVSRAAEDFTAGKTDVLFFALGSAAVKQAAATVGGVRVLPTDDSPEAQKRMQDVLPGSYVVEVTPAPSIDGVSEPTKVLAFDMVLCTSVDVPHRVVYEVVKALHQNKPALSAAFGAFNLLDPAKMSKPVRDVAFHPGALKYFQEAGIAPRS